MRMWVMITGSDDDWKEKKEDGVVIVVSEWRVIMILTFFLPNQASSGWNDRKSINNGKSLPNLRLSAVMKKSAKKPSDFKRFTLVE